MKTITTVSIVFVLAFVLSGCSASSSKPLAVTVQHDKAGRTYAIQGDASDVGEAIKLVQDK